MDIPMTGTRKLEIKEELSRLGLAYVGNGHTENTNRIKGITKTTCNDARDGSTNLIFKCEMCPGHRGEVWPGTHQKCAN
jgi:hypothetical protein